MASSCGVERAPSIARGGLLLVLSVLLVAVALGANGASVSGGRVLLVTDEPDSRYSTLVRRLQDRGFSVESSSASELSKQLDDGGFSHVAVLTRATHSLSASALVNWVASGSGNLVLAVPPGASDVLKDAAFEFGAEFGGSIARPASWDMPLATNATDATTLINSRVGQAIVPMTSADEEITGIAYRGLGHSLVDDKNPLVYPALFAGRSKSPRSNLATCVQATNGKRALVIGSTEVFTDDFLSAPLVETKSGLALPSSTADAVDQLLKWVLHEKNVVEVVKATHAKRGDRVSRREYRVKDEITFNITLREWSGDRYVPFLLPPNDELLFSAKMLDPYLRVPMRLAFTSASSSTYTVTTKLPDTYGHFTFDVTWARPGTNIVRHSELVAIRPFHHDEFPRFLRVAYPYYTAAVLQAIATVALVAVLVTRKHVYGSAASVAAPSADTQSDSSAGAASSASTEGDVRKRRG